MPSPKNSNIKIDAKKSSEGTPKNQEKSIGSPASTPGSTTSSGRSATASASQTPKSSPRGKVTVKHLSMSELNALLTPRGGQSIPTFPSTPSNAHNVKTPRYTAVTIKSSPLASPLTSPLTSPLLRSTKTNTDRATLLREETDSMQSFLNLTLENMRDCANRIAHVKSDVIKNAWEITQHDLSNFESIKKALQSYVQRLEDIKKSDSKLLNPANIVTIEKNLIKRNAEVDKIIPIINELKLAVKAQLVNIEKCGQILDKLDLEFKQIIPPSTPTLAPGI